jgi:hypothetical protein
MPAPPRVAAEQLQHILRVQLELAKNLTMLQRCIEKLAKRIAVIEKKSIRPRSS